MRIDLKKDFRDRYQPPVGRFVEVVLPEVRYLAIDGHGDPNTSPEYAAAIECLFTAGYAVRSAFKQRSGSDFVVGPLEGLWSSQDPSAFVDRAKGDWDWTMLIPLPDEVDRDDVSAGLAAAAKKKPGLPIASIELLTLTEGRCLQTMHLGSYDDETPVLATLHRELMPARGVTWNGRHHEVYLSDPRRTPAEKMKTVLRQPIAGLG